MEALLQLALAPVRDFFELAFLQRALLAGVVLGTVCSLLSVFVVLKNMAFIGQGISHAAFAGLALGLYVSERAYRPDLGIYLISGLYCLGVAFLIGLVSRRGRVSEDSAIGIFFVSSMALGVILLSLRRGYTAEVFGYLFGSILAVSPADVWVILGVGAVVGGLVVFFLKELYAYTFDEEMAFVMGLPVGALHFGLLALLALTVVVAARVVGIVLVNALLILPASTALALSARFGRVVALALAVGVGSSVLGLVLSNHLNLPSGATIVLLQLMAFALAHLRRR